MIKINEALQKNVIGAWGQTGKLWLDQLPMKLKEFENKLNIRINTAFANLNFNYVAPCRLPDGNYAIFKCGIPNDELKSEILALKYFDGNGSVKLIASNGDEGWLLIDKLEPGMMLSSVEDDDKATCIFVNITQQLHRPIKNINEFPTIGTWSKGFERLRREFHDGLGPFPKDLVDYAEKLSQELLKSSSKQVLLHGDLHHYNILSHGDHWLAIDPKGVIGEQEYEVSAFMKNPMPQLMFRDHLKKILKRRIDIIAEMTGFDRERLLAWSFVGAMLTAWWCYEGKNEGIKIVLSYAKILRHLK